MKAKMSEPRPEILNFSKEYADLFMKAVENAEVRTLISNTSIFKNNDGSIVVHDTQAYFLINVGIEYQKLLEEYDLSLQ